VPHELAEDEDRRLHEEGHRVVLEGCAVMVTHEVTDEAVSRGFLRRARVLAQKTLVPSGGDPGCRDDARVGCHGVDELHRHVAAELQVRLVLGSDGAILFHPLAHVLRAVEQLLV
jgi:hypothetical protein